MILDEQCEWMLSGKNGRLVQGAMEFLVNLGKAFEAKDMVDIDFAFVYTAPDILYARNKPLDFLSLNAFQEAIALGVKVKVPTISGIGAIDFDCCEFLQIPEQTVERLKQQVEMNKALGLICLPTCDPYLIAGTSVAPFGSHMASIESSAIPYYNSVLGARCNQDGIAAFFAALTGKYPRFGYHLDEKRRPSRLVTVRAKLKSYIDYGILGLIVGERIGPEVAAFMMNENPRPYELVHLGSGLASGGPVTMYHILGVTPEARTFDGILNRRNLRQVHEITDEDIRQVYSKYSGKDEPVDFVALGCPYYDVFELKKIAQLLKGRRIKNGVSLWVHADPLAKATAEASGFAQDIYEAGGKIICGTCPQISAGKPGPAYTFAHPEYTIGNLVTDSIKQAHYSGLTLRARKCFLGETDRCIEAAVQGTWR